MKTYSKAVFLMLATLATSASADTLWQTIHRAHDESQELQNVGMFEEETRPFDVIQTMPDQITGLEADEYDEVEKKEDDKEKKEKKDKKDKEKKDKDKDKKDKEDKKESKSEKKPTKKPTSRDSSSKSSKPSRKPTKKPTGRSSKSSSSSSSGEGSSRCVDKKKPSVSRSGYKYKFELEKSDAQCADKNGKRYEYGEFKKVKDFSKCADACVKDVRSSLLDSFRGYDYDCKKERCRCLYDRGTLDSRNSSRFDDYNRKEDGKGSVKKSKKKSDMYCAKLKSAKFAGMNGEFDEGDEEFEMEVSRALRGGAI